MGEVYLVQHPRLPRHDALKVLRPDVSSDSSFRERFIREADLAAGLRHPHIVGIHDRGEHEGQLWIAMDYIDGTDLAHRMAQRYPAGMPIDLVVPIITAVASALDYAHARDLLHRDVKPANIIVANLDSDDRRVFLADFGIARPLDDTNGITTTDMTVGTVAYAAPEQLMGEQLEGQADQYALAATAYEILTGLQ
jgi:serine/threonine-protein kinase